MQNNAERRYMTSTVEVRQRSDGGSAIAGYAAKFNRFSQNLGGFVEQILPGAFTKTVQEADVRGYFNHDSNFILGRTKSGTLRLAEDDTGLYYEIDLPKTTYARDLLESIERGDVNQSSFAFTAIDDEWGFTEQDFPLRSLKQVRLYDVSPVSEPAYTDTEVSVVKERALRSLCEKRGLEITDFDKLDVRSLLGDDEPEPEVEVKESPAPPSSLVMARKRLELLEHPQWLHRNSAR